PVRHQPLAARLVDRRSRAVEDGGAEAGLPGTDRDGEPGRTTADHEEIGGHGSSTPPALFPTFSRRRAKARVEPATAAARRQGEVSSGGASSPCRQRRTVSARRSLPEEVRGRVPGASTSTRSGGGPTAAATARRTASGR